MRCRRIHDKLCKTGQVSEVTMKRPQASYSRVGGTEKETEDFVATRSSSELDVMESILKKLREKEKDEHKMKKSGSRQALKSVSSSEASLTEDLEPDDKSVNPSVSLLIKKMTALENQMTVQQNQITLLTSLNDKHDKEISTLKSASKKDRDAMTTLEREVASLRDKNAISCQDKEQLRSEVTKLKDDVTRVRDYCTTLQVELDKLQGGQGAVQSDIATIQTEQAKLQTEQNTMKTEQGKLQTDLKKMQTDFAALKTEQDKSKGGDMKQDVEKLKKEVDDLKQKNIRMEKDSTSVIATLTNKLGAFSKQIAFQAILPGSNNVTLKEGETLICGRVISSVGGGYDPKTGVFTVPVAGVYCFMFTSRCGVMSMIWRSSVL